MKKGMVLAAGYGRRLLPITEKIPKPVIPILNIPNILYNVVLMREVGIKEIIINLHHLQKEVENVLGQGERVGVELTYSKETELLGTGGGVKNAESFFEGSSFVLCNCDFITDVNLEHFIDAHNKHQSIASMVLFENEALQPKYSKVGIDNSGHLCSLPKFETRSPTRTGIFTGVHLLESKIFNYLKKEFSGINETLYPSLMNSYPNHTYGFFMEEGEWHDTGELSTIWKSSMDLLAALGEEGNTMSHFLLKTQSFKQISERVWATGNTKVPASVDISGPVLIGKDVKFGKNISIGPNVIIGDNACIENNTTLADSIVLNDSIVEEKEKVSKSVVFGREKLPTKPNL